MKKVKTPRLPMAGVLALRSKGGAQTTLKGRFGYNRNKEKEKIRKEN